MTPAEFKAKWAKFSGKESAAYQEHFNDVCRMLRVKTPVEEDPTGSDTFCFQKRVVKDAELFDFDTPGNIEPASHERGFADVWKRDCFGWEYKGPGEDLEKGYKQLLRYRESLLNPPLLIVSDFARFIVRTNFNGAVQETHEFANADIDSPRALAVLRAALTAPAELRPKKTAAEVTEKLAAQIASVALSLQARQSVELADAKTRRQHSVAQKKNLRIARFLNRLVFCFFAEDTELLPKGIFSDVCKAGLTDPAHFAESLEDLFRCMAVGGRFGLHKIRHFNGHLFEDATVFELTPDEIEKLATAADSDWQAIQPSIMGTLFERALDDRQRGQLGAHYTSEADIKTLVEPVLMAPLRREWTALRRELAPAILKGKGTAAERDRLAAFQAKLAVLTVLDPACGSGNFLYVALQSLLGLEKEIITAAAQLGASLAPRVSVKQRRDFVVKLDGAPTGHCLHAHCADAVESFNAELRRRIAAAESSGNVAAKVPVLGAGVPPAPTAPRAPKRPPFDPQKLADFAARCASHVTLDWLATRSPLPVPAEREQGVETAGSFLRALYAADERLRLTSCSTTPRTCTATTSTVSSQARFTCHA